MTIVCEYLWSDVSLLEDMNQMENDLRMWKWIHSLQYDHWMIRSDFIADQSQMHYGCKHDSFFIRSDIFKRGSLVVWAPKEIHHSFQYLTWITDCIQLIHDWHICYHHRFRTVSKVNCQVVSTNSRYFRIGFSIWLDMEWLMISVGQKPFQEIQIIK